MFRTFLGQKLLGAIVVGAALTGAALPARAGEQISVSHWGTLMFGVPYAVALDRGFFQKAGVDIDGILSSKGGGTTMRNVLASGLPFGEVTVAAAIAAKKEGMDIKIVSGGVRTAADFFWVTLPNSNVRTTQDLVGKKLAITSKMSSTEMLALLMLRSQKLTPSQVQLVPLGTVAAGYAALDRGDVDVIGQAQPMAAMLPAGKYRRLIGVHDILPVVAQTVGVTTTQFAKANPQKLRAILEGRRMAVAYIKANPREAAISAVKYYRVPLEAMEQAIRDNLAVDYWSDGRIELDAMENSADGLRIIGEIEGPVDWKSMVDTSFLSKP